MLLKFAIEPRAGEVPVATDGTSRNVERFGDLFFGEAGKVTKLYDPRLPRIEAGQPRQGFVDRHHIHLIVRDLDIIGERNANSIAPALFTRPTTCRIDAT